MESSLKNATTRNLVTVSFNELFLAKCHRKLDRILESAFQPLESYIQNLAFEYNLESEVSTGENSFSIFLEDPSFEMYMSKVEAFTAMISNITGMVITSLKLYPLDKCTFQLQSKFEYFSIGRLALDTAKNALKDYATTEREKVTQKLINCHQTYNLDVCKSYEDLKNFVLDVPHDTKKLLALGK